MKVVYASLVVAMMRASTVASAQDGASCETAVPLIAQASIKVDTTTATNWMTAFGPLVSLSNDFAYTFTSPPDPFGEFTPTDADYAFAMYLIGDCSDLGTQPVPIGATGTVGIGIPLNGLEAGHQYYLAITGTAAGGAGANGHLTFMTPPTPVTLQSFEID